VLEVVPRHLEPEKSYADDTQTQGKTETSAGLKEKEEQQEVKRDAPVL
jgi:hypothetical protein